MTKRKKRDRDRDIPTASVPLVRHRTTCINILAEGEKSDLLMSVNASGNCLAGEFRNLCIRPVTDYASVFQTKLKVLYVVFSTVHYIKNLNKDYLKGLLDRNDE